MADPFGFTAAVNPARCEPADVGPGDTLGAPNAVTVTAALVVAVPPSFVFAVTWQASDCPAPPLGTVYVLLVAPAIAVPS